MVSLAVSVDQAVWSTPAATFPAHRPSSPFPNAVLESSYVRTNWGETGSSTVRLSDEHVQWLEALYVLRNRKSVLSFLESHPLLVSLLIEAHQRIGGYFPHSRLVLEAMADPEYPADSELVIYVQTDTNPEEAFERLQQLDDDWWLHAVRQGQGLLCMNVEFV